jgi:L-fuconolactonase
MQTTSPATATSLHLAVRPDWLARRQEAIIDPELPIIDPHHHGLAAF